MNDRGSWVIRGIHDIHYLLRSNEQPSQLLATVTGWRAAKPLTETSTSPLVSQARPRLRECIVWLLCSACAKRKQCTEYQSQDCRRVESDVM